MTPLPDAIADLARLNEARLKAAEYYAPLLHSPDDIVRIGAWAALLDREEVAPGQYEEVVALARHGAIKQRAFRFFQSNWDHDFAARVAAIEADDEAEAERRAMEAELNCDPAATVEAQRLKYLAAGRLDVLQKLIPMAEEVGGWREALPIAVKLMVIYPHDPAAASDLLEVLHAARQTDLLEAAIALLDANGLHAPVTLLYSAGLSLLKGNPRQALQRLQRLGTIRSDVLVRVMRRNLAMRLTAEALEKLGDYEKAYAAYVELKRIDKGSPVRLNDYYAVLKRGEELKVPSLPADPRTNFFVMTGFARSGTTLLENMLAAHPKIETFEEVPAGSSMQFSIDQLVPQAKSEAATVEAFLAARARYYDEFDRRHDKAEAEIFIDKMPMRAAEAKLIARVFPDRRYLFSIRHPFDVVLSSFKQYFQRNMAMDHFRSFDTAVKLYDYSMEQWFSTFSMTDPRVHYIRYDELVTDFDRVMRGTLGFLGTTWNDDILEFTKGSEERKARTPSYQKVRQGLSIGVQTQWRNYGFLFKQDFARPLHKWAEFFGYPTA